MLYHKCVGDCCNKEFGAEDSHQRSLYLQRCGGVQSLGAILQVEMEPDKLVHKNAVCVRKDGKVVGRLKKGFMGRYAKTIFYFLRGDPFSKCTAKKFGPRCNLGDGEGLQVPCELHIVDQKKYVDVLKDEL